MLDEWGIADGFHDVNGSWHPTSESTRHAIRQAMGEPRPGPPLWFVAEGAAPSLLGPCDLVTEDGHRHDSVTALPADVAVGYHQLVPCDGGPVTHVIVHPARCPSAPAGWGVAAQVYSLWRSDGWGIGDLRDVADLARGVAERGGCAVLLSPLHASAPTSPQETSPYFPSSRRWRNPLHIPPYGPPPAGVDNAAGGVLDRDAVWTARRAELHRRYVTESASKPTAAWRSWAVRQGVDLDRFCTWNALAELHGPRWQSWPATIRHPDAPGLRDLVASDTELAAAIDFHAWCQWVAHLEVAEATWWSSPCMLIGDLAVGCSPDGADAWSQQDLLALDVTIGAPADPFNVGGQDWGLPPFVPWRLRAARYEPFVAVVRASVESMAGLRIDHVMGLHRQFWIPAGGEPADGAYVHFDARELFALLRLEATRAGTFIVGEDLGTVDPAVREEMAASGILGTKVWLFEHQPEWPTSTLGTATTHDLPTLAGVWSGRDGTPEMRTAMEAVAPDGATAADAIAAVHAEVVGKGARLTLASLDDLAGNLHRPNRPGTLHSDERSGDHPNWCGRQTHSAREILDHLNAAVFPTGSVVAPADPPDRRTTPS